jgi:hypothetical protein
MTNLFRLALLLTGDAEKAENCIIGSIRDCIEGETILKAWLPPWIRDTIIRTGISMVIGVQADAFAGTVQCEPSHSAQNSIHYAIADYSLGILELSDFDRLVYVICILENYTSDQCGLLLGKAREEVREARNRALAHIAEFESTWRDLSENSSPCHCSPTNYQGIEFDSSCGHLLK